MPDPPDPQYEYYDGVKHGTGWKYLSKFYQCNADQLPGRILTDETEIALLESGNRKLESALRFVPEEKRERALTMIGYGKYMLATVRTLRNARRYRLEGSLVEVCFHQVSGNGVEECCAMQASASGHEFPLLSDDVIEGTYLAVGT